MNRLAFKQKTIKIVWAASAGRCSFPHCPEKLCTPTDESPLYTIGEMAHICGEKPGSNRHDPNMPEDIRDGPSNIILLCPTHHTLVDKKENENVFPPDLLRQYKAKHEDHVTNRLDIKHKTKGQVATAINKLFSENHAAWEQYGPFSEIAKKNPHSESAYAAWLSERLGTIVPNNRSIVKLIEEGADFFSTDEHKSIASFLQHARSYEAWVDDKNSYESVTRFPKDFEHMIQGVVNAGS